MIVQTQFILMHYRKQLKSLFFWDVTMYHWVICFRRALFNDRNWSFRLPKIR